MASPEKAANPRSNLLPPYAPYRTFRNFIDSLKQGIPARIDRSMMPSMSGALQSQLTHALRVLLLISNGGQPTETLPKLVNAEGVEREKIMHEVVNSCYQFIFLNMDIKTATPRMLEEAFANLGASGGTLDKCLLFFLAAAKDAGIELSPHLKRTRGPRIVRARSRSRVTDQIDNGDDSIQPNSNGVPDELTWEQMLLSKFPTFDPAWPDEVKSKWFDGFHRLMRVGKPEGSE
jgi:hypothetical protein